MLAGKDLGQTESSQSWRPRLSIPTWRAMTHALLARVQELLQLVEQTGKVASGAASRVGAGDAAAATASSDTSSGSPAAGGDHGPQSTEQPDVMMALGPAKRTGEAAGGSSSDEL